MLFMRVRLTLFLVLFSVPLHSARASDAHIEGAKLCTTAMPRYEREYGVPTHLLSAIASTETGRWHNGLKITLPWPWTINADGKGYFFDTKQEALTAARNLRARGVKSMDVGCMQVNLYHHPNAFRSLEDAFDPAQNVAYAASFLRSLYESEGSWKNAASAYHSKTPARGSQYLSRVYDKWLTILDRLRLSKAPVQQAAQRTTPSPVALTRLPESHTTPMRLPPRSTTLAEQNGKRLAPQRPVHMKIIDVSSPPQQREQGVLIVRPDVEPAATSLQVASAKSPPANAAPAAPSGPRFIFND